jgi:hypothetical protein
MVVVVKVGVRIGRYLRWRIWEWPLESMGSMSRGANFTDEAFRYAVWFKDGHMGGASRSIKALKGGIGMVWLDRTPGGRAEL